jgi:hypothetical protein
MPKISTLELPKGDANLKSLGVKIPISKSQIANKFQSPKPNDRNVFFGGI